MAPAPPDVVPRWEWRTFGAAVAGPARRLAAETPDDVQESEEVYLVSRAGTDTVKARGGLLDLKHLEEVDDHGLERWRPVMKEPLPVPAAAAEAALAALGVDAPSLDRGPWGVEDLARVLEAAGAGRRVTVRKRRERYAIGGCAAELTDVEADGTTLRSFAIESEDPARVLRSLGELGLAGEPNVSYPLMLRRLSGLAGARGAAIDVGTNSVKLHVAERSGAGWSSVLDRALVTRLGEGLRPGGALGDEPMRRTAAAVCELAGQARRAGAGLVAVGTAGLRMASNGAEFTRLVEARCGVRIEIISGEEESRLGYLAAAATLGRRAGSVVVVETGGGSSQFTFGDGDSVRERFSVDVGAVALTERFGLDGRVSPDALAAAAAAARAGLGRLDGRPRPDALIGMGGALTNLAAVRHGLAVYDPEVVEGTVLDRGEIDRQIALYAGQTSAGRSRIVGLQSGRAEVILAGALIVRSVLDALGCDAVTVTDRGLRHALVAERFGG